MEAKDLRSPEEDEIIAALSVFVDAGKELDKLIDLRNEKLAKASYKSPEFNSTGRNSRGYKKDKMAEAMASLQKIDKRVSEILNNYQKHVDQVQGIINTLYPNYNQIIVMEWRYINGEGWDYIAQKTGFSKSYCFNLHKKAIATLVKKGTTKNLDKPQRGGEKDE